MDRTRRRLSERDAMELSLEEYLSQIVSASLPGHPRVLRIEAVQHGRLVRGNIWRIEIEGGLRVAAKKVLQFDTEEGRYYDSLRAEITALRLLYRNGCAVPRIYSVDEAQGLIILEWCGDRTLDDICQAGNEETRRKYARRLVESFCHIEKVFLERADELEPYIFPTDLQEQGKSLSARGRAAGKLRQLLSRFGFSGC